MREAHAHVAALGEALTLPRLDGCRSLGDALDRLRLASEAAEPGAWVRLAGARPESWPEHRWPTLAELDRACPARPCVVMSFDHHAAVANTLALEAASLTPGQRVGTNGEVRADPRTGGPTGLLLEDAAYAAWRAAPEATDAERRSQIRAALDHLVALGYSEVHDLHCPEWLGPLLGDMDKAGSLPIPVGLYPNVRVLPEVAAGRAAWETPRVRLLGGKIFADGTLNSRTALMLGEYREPLDERSRRGRAMVSPDDLVAAIRLTESLGLHLATHAIGDGAVRMVLDAIEAASGLPRDAAPDARHRIEHCEIIDKADIPRFARLGVVCSVQPCHLLTDMEVLGSQLPHRLDRVLPLRDLIDARCAPAGPNHSGLLWFGSDAPIVRADPGDSIQAAVHRRRADMPEGQAIGREQRLTETEAWACFGGAPSHTKEPAA